MKRKEADLTDNPSTFKSVRKILVIKLRHIGDVLLSAPAMRALKESFPDAKVSVLINSGTEESLSGNPAIDELIIFDRSIKKLPLVNRIAKEIAFLRKIRAKGFDMAVDLTNGDRAVILSYFSGARYRLAADPGKKGFAGKRYLYTHLANIDKQKHMVFQNLDVVKQFGIDAKNEDVDFFIPEEAKAFVKKIFKENSIEDTDKVVHIHPTSRWLWKCWKDEYMAEIIGWLIEKGIKVIVTSAPDGREMEKAKRILSLISDYRTQNTEHRQNNSELMHISGDSPSRSIGMGQSPLRVLDLAGKTTIKQLAAISEASDLFVGVDSAPMHIAAAVGTPVVALFGPTLENLWAPYSRGHIVISKDMPCKPCKKGSCEGVELRECMKAIKQEDVKKAVSKLLRTHNC
ncbi:MAG: glycosyltransferase family 9 protein [Nitrospirae bacterium]|nr:glycosyltransferase family 9 protein [Nitrospirota bacterium]